MYEPEERLVYSWEPRRKPTHPSDKPTHWDSWISTCRRMRPKQLLCTKVAGTGVFKLPSYAKCWRETDGRPECDSRNHRTLRKNKGMHLHDPGAGHKDLDPTPKAWAMTTKQMNWTYSNLKTWRKYLQITCLLRVQCPGYIKYSCNPTTKTQRSNFKTGKGLE